MTKCPRCGGETTDRHKHYGRQGRGPKAGTIGAVRVHVETGMVGCERGERGADHLRTTKESVGGPPNFRSNTGQTSPSLPSGPPGPPFPTPPQGVVDQSLMRRGGGEIEGLVVHDGPVPHNDGEFDGPPTPILVVPTWSDPRNHAEVGGPVAGPEDVTDATPPQPDSSNDLLTSYFDA